MVEENVDLDVEAGEVKKGVVFCTELEDGSPVVFPYFVMRGLKGKKPVLLLNAAIHGDELNGIEVINRVFEEVKLDDLCGTVVGVPVVNTLAFRARSRVDPIDDKNLNRVFPGKKNGTVTERIAYHFFNDFVKKADFGIDLHTGMKGHLLVPHPRLRTLNGFKPSLEHYRAVGTEFIFQNEGEKGMLNIEAGKIGIPVVCFEIGVASVLDEYYIDTGFRGVLNFMRFYGMLDGEAEIPRQQVLLSDYHEEISQIGGLFYPKVKPGDVVSKGQLLGVTKSPYTGEKYFVKAPDDCYIVGIRSQPVVRQGTTVAWLMTFEKGDILPPLSRKNVRMVSSKIFDDSKNKGIRF
ncbi:MAG: succinylglutamate desuccinylase/aspartoacylase family protein [Thermoplasmata archaeon]|nr:succinylglutamate desuccinylase/aspartoacylase family protein [Thermoplasmata archaeon]